jgi:hypothetical protein
VPRQQFVTIAKIGLGQSDQWGDDEAGNADTVLAA